MRVEAGFESRGLPTAEDAVFPIDSGDTSPWVPGAVIEICSALRLALSRRRRQQRDLSQHAGKQLARQVTLRHQQPVVARVFDESSAGFHQTLLQAGSRPLPRSARAARAVEC